MNGRDRRVCVRADASTAVEWSWEDGGTRGVRWRRRAGEVSWDQRPSKREVVLRAVFGAALAEGERGRVGEDDAVDLKRVVHLADGVEDAAGRAKTGRLMRHGRLRRREQIGVPCEQHLDDE